MPVSPDVLQRLSAIDGLTLVCEALLARYTRFGIGGKAALLCETANAVVFERALGIVRQSNAPHTVIGGGSNLIVSDEGFNGIVLRFRGQDIHERDGAIHVEAGLLLQQLVNFSIDHGLAGMQTMTGIPGEVGGAIYGNAGAYGHAIEERVTSVMATNGHETRVFSHPDCQFRYRESYFKRNKEWVVLSSVLHFQTGEVEALGQTALEIRKIRDAKYPPTMKCAGSIFKNLMFADLPEDVRPQVPPNLVRDGKVPSAWFLEQAGVRGISIGDIQVAEYHANLIYNDGAGKSADLMAVIDQCKSQVFERFGFELEEEVQYIGFAGALEQSETLSY